MREELCALVRRLEAGTGARPVVLPPPYARGHFRLYGEHWPEGEDFAACVEGGNTFVALTPACLERELARMDARAPAVPVCPERSPLDTLLHQILTHGFAGGELDCPQLARLCLDLDADPARCGRIIERMQRLMLARYAECLRLGQQQSMLPAVARQVAFYKERYCTQRLKKGGI